MRNLKRTVLVALLRRRDNNVDSVQGGEANPPTGRGQPDLELWPPIERRRVSHAHEKQSYANFELTWDEDHALPVDCGVKDLALNKIVFNIASDIDRHALRVQVED